jgi:hypothetical protein
MPPIGYGINMEILVTLVENSGVLRLYDTRKINKIWLEVMLFIIPMVSLWLLKIFKKDEPISYLDFIRISLPVSTTHLFSA